MFGNTFSQKWIPLGNAVRGEAVTKEVLEDDENSYKVRISLNGLYDKEVTNELGTFHSVSFGTEGQLRNVGEPSLPVIPYLIAIPPGTTPIVTIEDESWESISIGKILPEQKPSYDMDRVSEFYIKEDVYNHSYIPQMVNQTKEMNWRGVRNVGLQVCPFKYHPQKDTLSVLKEFVINIEFNNQDKESSVNTNLQKSSSQFGVFDNTVYSESPLRSNNNVNDNYDYLIIVANDTIFTSQKMTEFRRWKALKGYKTKVVTYNSIGTAPSYIKNYICNEYDKGVRYVLLVGNCSNIPSYDYSYTNSNNQSTICASDYWYGCVLGNDAEQDVAIGRFPARTFNQFSNMVDKTLKYETYKNLAFKTLLIAHMEPEYILCCDSIWSNSYSVFTLFYRIYGTNNSVTNATINNRINSKAHIVNYRGHASSGYWGDPAWNENGESYTITQIDSLNDNTNAVFYSIACSSGDITTYNSMLDVFLRSPRGAVAFFGASKPTNTGVNTYYNKTLYKNLIDSMVYCYGDLNMNTYIDVFKTYNNWGPAVDDAYSYICGGDPTLELWTSYGKKITGVDVNYSNGNIIVSTTDTCKFKVYLSSVDGELLGSFTTNNQTATIPIPANNANQFYFSLINHNRIPYVVYCDLEKNYLQALDVDYNGFYANTPFSMGEFVDVDDDIGDVVVKYGSKLIIKLGTGGVLLDGGFRVESGGALNIK